MRILTFYIQNFHHRLTHTSIVACGSLIHTALSMAFSSKADQSS